MCLPCALVYTTNSVLFLYTHCVPPLCTGVHHPLCASPCTGVHHLLCASPVHWCAPPTVRHPCTPTVCLPCALEGTTHCALPLYTHCAPPLCTGVIGNHQRTVTTLCEAHRRAARILCNRKVLCQSSTASVAIRGGFSVFVYCGGWRCGNTGHSTRVESREQLTGVCPLLPPRGPWESNPGSEA